MEDFEKEAINTALYWNEEGFNKRNREIFIEYMHFPNIRLWENQFFIFETEEEIINSFDDQSESLLNEGWHHTVTLNIKAIQSDETKVHLLLHQSRRNKNNEEYDNFHTLWIVTKINNKWGIQFRSSFLDGATHINEQGY